MGVKQIGVLFIVFHEKERTISSVIVAFKGRNCQDPATNEEESYTNPRYRVPRYWLFANCKRMRTLRPILMPNTSCSAKKRSVGIIVSR